MMRLSRLLIALALAALAPGAQAKYNGENRGKPVMPAATNAKWQAECSSCHMAYPPGLMSAASWQKVMAGLDKHFGTDASLDAATTREITDYLTAHPSNRWTAATAPIRITEAEWFKVKHGKIGSGIFQRASIKSPANCNACHQHAEGGVFDEHGVQIPK